MSNIMKQPNNCGCTTDESTRMSAESTDATGHCGLGTIAENPSLAYQCAKCSAGCPVAEEMDVLPHRLMHYLALGMEDKALRANTIWMCAGCFTCAVRCPNDIDITSVMDGLRAKAIRLGIPCPKSDVLKFHKTFLGDMARRGRVHELR